eukprot:sb/3465511/
MFCHCLLVLILLYPGTFCSLMVCLKVLNLSSRFVTGLVGYSSPLCFAMLLSFCSENHPFSSSSVTVLKSVLILSRTVSTHLYGVGRSEIRKHLPYCLVVRLLLLSGVGAMGLPFPVLGGVAGMLPTASAQGDLGSWCHTRSQGTPPFRGKTCYRCIPVVSSIEVESEAKSTPWPLSNLAAQSKPPSRRYVACRPVLISESVWSRSLFLIFLFPSNNYSDFSVTVFFSVLFSQNSGRDPFLLFALILLYPGTFCSLMVCLKVLNLSSRFVTGLVGYSSPLCFAMLLSFCSENHPFSSSSVTVLKSVLILSRAVSTHSIRCCPVIVAVGFVLDMLSHKDLLSSSSSGRTPASAKHWSVRGGCHGAPVPRPGWCGWYVANCFGPRRLGELVPY